MSNTKRRDPDVDYGYHAVIPRMVRTEHKDLSPTELWLYVCLKDLCGDNGVCYRTLRILAEEANMSIAMLSKSIPILHKAGLIHAEKKRRSNNPTAKEVWHITIVDVWEANAKLHPTKRLRAEQNTDNVHMVNNNVHTVNETEEECSQNEQKCSQNGGQKEDKGSSNITEVITHEEDIPANVIKFPNLTADEQQWLEDIWCHAKFIKVPPDTVSDTFKKHITKLSQHIKTVEQINSLYDYTRNQAYLKGRPAKPGDLAGCLNDWYQTQLPKEVIQFPKPTSRKDELEVFTGPDAIRRQDALEREEALQRQLKRKGIPA